MISLVRSLLGVSLKTNDNLELAVLTGCLRVSKESVFTGMNNLEVFSITDELFDRYFGFTADEVRELIAYYGLDECYEDMKLWYDDGYRFGSTDVYCPWDVPSHCRRLVRNPKTKTQNYWINTSGNGVVKRFIGMANQGRTDGGALKLRIPNLEVRDVFAKQIREYFKESIRSDTDALDRFYTALQQGDAETVEKLFTNYLRRSISIRDTMVKDERKEISYQGVMIGILTVNDDWDVRSNRESGDGYADELINEGMTTILKYGIGCNKKVCKVVLGK